MKSLSRIFQTTVLALFLAFTVGIPLHKHYCGEKLFAAGITAQDCCCEDTKENPDDCCKTEYKVYNIDDHYELTKGGKINLQAPATLVSPLSIITEEEAIETELAAAKELPDPSPGKIPIYQLIQQYTIYG